MPALWISLYREPFLRSVGVSDTNRGSPIVDCGCTSSEIGWCLHRKEKSRLCAMIGKRGQTLVEFAFILPLFLLLMLGVIQMIIVGGAALAVSQAAITCARYASLNPTYTSSEINSYLQSSASPLINDSGLAPLVLSPTSVPRRSGTAVSVTVSYNLANKLFLGSSFFGLTFPTEVSATQTMTSE